MGVVVHHLNASRSERIPWILEELGVPYEVKVHYRTKAGVAPKSLAAVSPLGKAPCVILDGETLIESGPIVSRLIETYSSPSNAHVEAPASAKSQFWSHFSEASFMNILAAGRVVEIGAAGLAPSMSPQEAAGAQKLVKWHKAYVRGGVTQVLGLVEKFLKQNENFSGSEKLGEGDIMLGWALFLLAPENGATPTALGPVTEAWIKRTRARPAYARAIERIRSEEKAQAPKAKL